MIQRTRAIAIALALLLATAGVAGVGAADGDEVLTPQTADQIGIIQWSTPDDAVRTGGVDATPTWVVSVEDNRMSALRSWANQSDSRSIERASNRTDTATVAASASDIGVTFVQRALNRGLQHQGYVTQIALNRELPYPEPVSEIQTADAFEAPADEDEFDTGGLAFRSNTNETTLQDGREAIGAAGVSATGDGVTIAVVDTGLNTAGDSSVFGDRVLNASKNTITNETVGDAGIEAIEDGNGHGTWVAAAAAANHSDDRFDGVAPDADLLALKALADDGSGSTADIAHAIRYAADNDADVIAASLGSPVYSEELADAIRYALDERNVSAVSVATGNSRQTTRWVASPADVQGVLSVGATNTSDPGTAASATFSQIGPDPGTTDLSDGASRGATVDVAAPGTTLTAKVPTTSGGVTNSTLSGTSMAQPYVAGGAAVVLDADGSLVGDSEAVRERLTTTASPAPNTAESEVGHGMVNVSNAVSDTQPDTAQADAMDTAAQSRDTVYRGLSDGSGGLLRYVPDVPDISVDSIPGLTTQAAG